MGYCPRRSGKIRGKITKCVDTDVSSWPNTPTNLRGVSVAPNLATVRRPAPAQQTVSAPQKKVVPRSSGRVTAKSLREDIERSWHLCREAIATGNKAAIRALHQVAKEQDGLTNYENLRADLVRYRSYFPSCAHIEPELIEPELIPVRSRSLEERLFKIVRGYWSMPYSKGYGRRLRFIVMDRHHEAVMGIIGLQSPSADLACRDDYLGVPKADKLKVVNNTLDAYTIGATPTYAPLLAGKLVAGLLHAPLVQQEYWRIYGNKRTTQLKQRVPQPLLAITTASAFGRSSIYNKLRNEDRLLAKPLGFTKGFGTFHLEEHYPRITRWLEQRGRCVPAGFGNGPKVRWQNIMRALVDLKISRDFLEHGLRREVFIFELITNLQDVCQNHKLPQPAPFDAEQWAAFWKSRWCLPRVERNPEWYEADSLGVLRQALGVA